MDNYPKFAAWAKLREGLADDPKRGTTTDADAEFLSDFKAKLEREGVSPSIKAIYKHQMDVRPDLVPHMQKLIKAHQGGAAKPAAPALDPNSAEVTGMDPDTGQIVDPKKHDAWKAEKRKKHDAEAAERAKEPVYTPRNVNFGDMMFPGSGSEEQKAKHAGVMALRDFVTAAVKKYPTIEPERIIKHAKFQELLNAIPGYDDRARALMTKQMLAHINDIRPDQPTSGPTATPTSAQPAGKKGGFMNWLMGNS